MVIAFCTLQLPVSKQLPTKRRPRRLRDTQRSGQLFEFFDHAFGLVEYFTPGTCDYRLDDAVEDRESFSNGEPLIPWPQKIVQFVRRALKAVGDFAIIPKARERRQPYATAIASSASN